MSILDLAEKDLGMILEDDVNGFGVPCSITNPAGLTVPDIKVQTGDIHLILDMETDAKISNRVVHISARISTLIAEGLEIPRAQPNQSANPWIFEFADVNGVIRKFTVSDSKPDRKMGVVTIILELLKDA